MIERLGWTLIHFLWQGAAGAAAAWVGLQACRSARSRYGLLLVIFIAMAAAPVVTFFILGGMEAPRAARLPLQALSDAPVLAGDGAVPDPGSPSWPAWVVDLWLAGVGCSSLRMMGGWLLTRRMLRERIPAPQQWLAAAHRLAAGMGLRGRLRLVLSNRIDVPAVAGHFRPLILLPAAALANLPVAQLEALLAHELAHLARRDPLVNLLQSVVETLLFYHPAVWWVSSRMREEREHCCDDLAVAACGSGARHYAEALLALEESRPGPEAFALSAHGGSLSRRIARLLQPAPHASARNLLPALPALLTVLAAGALTTRSLIAQKASSEPVVAAAGASTGVQPALAPRFEQFLDEVALLIEPEERAAFLRLGHDAERDEFVEQFWKRRDPTPATPENEVKTEHYRRIAYANSRFEQGSIAGSHTIRGRLYILVGPPDEIESHPEKWEAWRYRYMEGLGQVTWTFDLVAGKLTAVDASDASDPAGAARLKALRSKISR